MTITIESGITIAPGIAIGDIPVFSSGGGLTHTITPVGQAQVSTAQAKFGTGSYTSNNLSGYLRVNPFSDLAWGTGNFTMEFWYRPVAFSTASTLIGLRPASTEGAYPVIFINTNSSVGYYVSAVTRITSATTVITANTWNSIAVVRSAGNTRMYINGNQSGSTFVDSFNYQAGNCIIAGNDFTLGSAPILGNMDEIRLSNIARYTANYTPATSAFTTDNFTKLLIHCDGTNGSNVFVDMSSAI
jgi:hypothetical protein